MLVVVVTYVWHGAWEREHGPPRELARAARAGSQQQADRHRHDRHRQSTARIGRDPPSTYVLIDAYVHVHVVQLEKEQVILHAVDLVNCEFVVLSCRVDYSSC